MTEPDEIELKPLDTPNQAKKGRKLGRASFAMTSSGGDKKDKSKVFTHSSDPKPNAPAKQQEVRITETVQLEPTRTNNDFIAKQATKERVKDLGSRGGNPNFNDYFELELRGAIAGSKTGLDFSCLIFDQLGEYLDTIFWDKPRTSGLVLKEPHLISFRPEKLLAPREDWKTRTPTTLIFAITVPVDQQFIKNCDFSLAVTQKDKTMKTIKPPPEAGGSSPKPPFEFICKWTAGNKVSQKIDGFNCMFVCRIYREHHKWEIQNLVNHYSLKSQGPLASLFYIPLDHTINNIIPSLVGNENIVSPPSWTTIKVQIHRGFHLSVRDISGSSDPCIKVHVEGKLKGQILEKKQGGAPLVRKMVHKTATIPHTLNPEWANEIANIPYSGNSHVSTLIFEVLDRDFFGRSESLGFATVDISKLQPNVEASRWLPLSKMDHEKKNPKTENSERPARTSSALPDPKAIHGSILVSLTLISPLVNTEPREKEKEKAPTRQLGTSRRADRNSMRTDRRTPLEASQRPKKGSLAESQRPKKGSLAESQRASKPGESQKKYRKGPVDTNTLHLRPGESRI